MDKEVEAEVKDESLVPELEAAEHYRDVICVTRMRVTRKLEALRTSDVSTTTPTDTAGLRSAPARHVATYVKLPKLAIPKFEENVQHWRPFIGQFEESIHNNKQLSAVEKFR